MLLKLKKYYHRKAVLHYAVNHFVIHVFSIVVLLIGPILFALTSSYMWDSEASLSSLRVNSLAFVRVYHYLRSFVFERKYFFRKAAAKSDFIIGKNMQFEIKSHKNCRFTKKNVFFQG